MPAQHDILRAIYHGRARSGAVATARNRDAWRDDSTKTLASSSVMIYEQQASCLGPPACESHGRRKIMSLGQRQRIQQRR